MPSFVFAALRSTIVVATALVPAKQDMSRSIEVFAFLASFATIACVFVMVGLAGGWRKVFHPSRENGTIVPLAGFALLITALLLIVVYKGALTRNTTHVRVSSRKRPLNVPKKLPVMQAGHPVEVAPKRILQAAQPVVPPPPRPPMPAPKAKEPVLQKAKAAPPVPRRRPEPKAAPVQISKAVKTAKAVHDGAPVQVAKASKVVHDATPVADRSPKKTNVVVHLTEALSDSQTRRMCNAVSQYAGAQVFIKWSPGANAEQFARQVSKAMDCARVTVTYASEAPGLSGHGVRVGTHRNEGETSDRLEPFADAVATALREQGFSVSQISGPNIPSDQTAIFIGPN